MEAVIKDSITKCIQEEVQQSQYNFCKREVLSHEPFGVFFEVITKLGRYQTCTSTQLLTKTLTKGS